VPEEEIIHRLCLGSIVASLPPLFRRVAYEQRLSAVRPCSSNPALSEGPPCRPFHCCSKVDREKGLSAENRQPHPSDLLCLASSLVAFPFPFCSGLVLKLVGRKADNPTPTNPALPEVPRCPSLPSR
jgi:hypothetical protein